MVRAGRALLKGSLQAQIQASAQWQRIGMNAIRTRQRQRSRNGASRTLVRSSSIVLTTGRSTTDKNLSGSTELNLLGLTNKYDNKAIHACAVSGSFSGETSKRPRMSIIATKQKQSVEFSATDAIQFSVCAKTTTSCFHLWRGI